LDGELFSCLAQDIIRGWINLDQSWFHRNDKTGVWQNNMERILQKYNFHVRFTNLRYFQIFLKESTGRCEAHAYPTWYLDETTAATQCSQLLICVQ
jgi:hypothetical protein